MLRRLLIIGFLIASLPAFCSEQVRIGLFSDADADLAIFAADSGRYVVNTFSNNSFEIAPGEIVIISRYGNRIYLKTRNREGMICDSLFFSGKSGNRSFSLRVKGIRRFYSGDLHCYPDLGSLLLINICDIETYIAGVVRSEGGQGKNIEYFKTQAVIARTYMYRYFDKHTTDRFNLCDITHCQAFNGISGDTLINLVALETSGEVILGPDSTLIIAAFHSNCGGETAPSETVWVTNEPYLKKVTDPFCTSSRNARWQTTMSREAWTGYLEKMGYKGDKNNPSLLNFSQKTRSAEIKSGAFSIPLSQVRTDLNLRSAFFTLMASGDSVVFNGRGYGHGVGLCQEGAMSMAEKGFDYRQIISFYFTGVVLADISEAKAKDK
ncbi:MAG: SpoIID/LytB domain-containing protein [Bacteroidota bacterium]